MATLADELLNDFEDDSGSEVERDEEDAGHGLEHGLKEDSVGAVPGDDEDDVMADEEKEYAEARRRSLDAKQTEEEPSDIEKMQLAGVSDVQNVARLMKTIRPILE
ncbi:U4/U6-U5 snRNP complex subunit prp31, partial [Ascosphaera pollenicola]